MPEKANNITHVEYVGCDPLDSKSVELCDNSTYVEFKPELYTIKTSALTTNTNNNSTTRTDAVPIYPKGHNYDPSPHASQPHDLVRIVHINEYTCKCPNCGDKISPMAITDSESSILLNNIHLYYNNKYIHTHNNNNNKSIRSTNINNIIHKAKDEYTNFINIISKYTTNTTNINSNIHYIIDVRNVALHGRHYDSVFSYTQVELVIKKLQKISKGKSIIICIYICVYIYIFILYYKYM